MTSEHSHQVTLINWFDKKYPQYRLFAIPNGGLRNRGVAIKMKLEGVRRGVPDLFLPVANSEYHGLFIELKKEGGRATKEQKEWINYLNEQGYLAVICHGWKEAATVIDLFLIN